ncbi:hypothetical protein [Clostridium prolinivorans]|uniref:hypothetical protein n=1 Tax=Clostridium prolinivorans TaxID=2769420 RepID=UPI000FDA703C|nr:hypothetical protein [Clostridium prolinivorans]
MSYSVVLGAAVVFGTGGLRTAAASLIVAGFAAVVPGIAGAILGGIVNGVYRGKTINFNVASAWFLPNFHMTL